MLKRTVAVATSLKWNLDMSPVCDCQSWTYFFLLLHLYSVTAVQCLLFNVISSLSRHYVTCNVGLHVRCRTFVIRISSVLPDLAASFSVNFTLCTSQFNHGDVAPFIAITDITVNWLSPLFIRIMVTRCGLMFPVLSPGVLLSDFDFAV